MKHWARAAGAMLMVASTGYFIYFAHRTAQRYDLHTLATPRVAVAIVVSALTYASIVPTTAWAWRRLLGSIGVDTSLEHLNIVVGLTQIAKYLPGNVGQYFGRVAMATARGIPVGAVLITLGVETVLAAAAALLVGAIFVASYVGTSYMPDFRDTLARALSCLGLASVCLAVVWRYLPRILRKLGVHTAVLPGRSALGGALAAYSFNYLCIGVGLYAISWAIAAAPPDTLTLHVGAFALAWLAGAVVPGAPAGLGVREAALVWLLSSVATGARCLEIVICLRIATTLGDLLAFAWGGMLLGREAATRVSVVRREA